MNVDTLTPGDPVSIFSAKTATLFPGRFVLSIDPTTIGVVVGGIFVRADTEACSLGHFPAEVECVGVGASFTGWSAVTAMRRDPLWDADGVRAIAREAGLRVDVDDDGPRFVEIAVGTATILLTRALDGLDPAGLTSVGIALCGLRERTMPHRWEWVATLPTRNAALVVQALGALLGLTVHVPEFVAGGATPGASADTPRPAEAPTGDGQQP